MQININDKAIVRLTDSGRKHLSEWVLTWSKPGEVCVEKWFPQMSNGTTEFSLWELMQIFGPALYNGCTLPFDTNIIVEPSPLMEL